MPEDEQNVVNAYIIMTGDPIPAEEALRIIGNRAVVATTDSDALRINVNGCEAELCGISHGYDSCSKLWFRLWTPISSIQKFARELAGRLQWNTEIRWGVPGGHALLPPRLDSLIASRHRRDKKRRLVSISMSVITLIMVATLYVIITTPRVAPWHTILAGAFSFALVASLGFYYYSYCRMRSAHKRLDTWLPMTWLLVMLWYSLGGPTSWIPLLVISTPTVLLGCGLIALRRRQKRSGHTAMAQVEHAMLKSALLRDFFVPRVAAGACIVCGHNLHGLPSCKCPECGTTNYYLLDRPDARELAMEHGAIFHGR